MTPKQQETYDLVKSGLSIQQVADRLGETKECIKSRWRGAKTFSEADPSAQTAAKAVGAGVIPNAYWATVDGISAYFKPEQTAD